MRCVREYIARIDEGHWILLSQRLKGKWAFLIWDAEPLSGDLGPAAEQTAKEQVAAFAKRHSHRIELLAFYQIYGGCNGKLLHRYRGLGMADIWSRKLEV